MLRCLVFSLLFHCASCLHAQHASLHWYNLKSVAPLDQAEGKIALTRMKQITSDTIATFTDRGDYFQLATWSPIDWPLFYQTMSEAGYFIADVTRTEVHHQDYVKMGLAYQETYYLAEHPELCATWSTIILLNEEEWTSFDADKQSFIQNHPTHFLIK